MPEHREKMDKPDHREKLDEAFMRVALEWAKCGEGHVEPNPMVGCVLTRDDKVIGHGYHKQFGGPHAEIVAINSLESPPLAQGATAYVTLEPCCHHGKTPPCSEALIKAGVKRVVVAMPDPFPKVDGGGLKQLSEAGIQTTVGVLADEAAALNAPYLKKLRTGVPWMIAKWAMTVDGRIATIGGESQWITNDQSRQRSHTLRGRVDAVVVGMGTVVADDPMLTARPADPKSKLPRTATRVVFCRNRLPDLDSKLVRTASSFPVKLVTGSLITKSLLQPYLDLGIDVFETQTDDSAKMIASATKHFGDINMTNVMIEGGGELLGSFLAAGCIDECHVYVGAKLFGGNRSPGPIGGAGIRQIIDANTLELQQVDSLGDDVRMIYRCKSIEG